MLDARECDSDRLRVDEEDKRVLSDSAELDVSKVGNSFSLTSLDLVPPVLGRLVTALFLSDAFISLERFIHDESTFPVFAGFDIILLWLNYGRTVLQCMVLVWKDCIYTSLLFVLKVRSLF